MNNLTKTLLALAVLPMIAVSAQAQVGELAGSPYIGAKAGQIILDDEGLDSLDNANALGAVIGYQATPSIGVEVEYMGSKSADLVDDGVAADYKANTYGLYGTYKHNFNNSPVYASARVGVAKVRVEVDELGEKSKYAESGVAGGLGLGYNVTPKVNVEAQYNMFDNDADARIWSVGANYKF